MAVFCAVDQAAWEVSPEHVRAMHHGTAAVLATALFDFVTRATLERAHGGPDASSVQAPESGGGSK